MTIKLAKRVFKGSEEEGKKLVAEAKKRVPCGIYALEFKDQDYIELVFYPCSKTEMKRLRRDYKKQGVKVYANGI